MHPYLQTRDESNHFAIFFEEVKKYEDKFFGFTRMSIKTFEELLTQFRNSIKPDVKLIIVLR